MAVTVGFIGVGNMGNPMASNVLKAQFPMTVFDTNPKAMENLIQAGARRAASPREVVETSEIVFTSLPASPDVEAVYLEPGGLVDQAKPGTILIDLSSVLPSTPRKIEPRAKARGVHFLEAPVSGGVKAGLDPMTIYEEVKASSGGSKALERIPKALIPRDFEPGFKVALMNKDLDTFNTIAKELHVPVAFPNVAQRYQQAALAARPGEQA